MANLIFGGRRIGNASLQFSAARGILPEIENTTQVVGVADGSTLLNSRLKSRVISVTYDVMTLSRRELERQLAPLLYSRDVQELIIDDRPDEVWYAKVDGKIDMDRAYFLGTGTIDFLVPDGVAHSVDTVAFDNKDPKWQDAPLNLLVGTSDQVTSGNIPKNNWTPVRQINRIPVTKGQKFKYTIFIPSENTVDLWAAVDEYAGTTWKGTHVGNLIQARKSGISTLVFTVADGIDNIIATGVRVPNRIPASDTTVYWQKEKLETAVPEPQYANVPVNLIKGSTDFSMHFDRPHDTQQITIEDDPETGEKMAHVHFLEPDTGGIYFTEPSPAVGQHWVMSADIKGMKSFELLGHESSDTQIPKVTDSENWHRYENSGVYKGPAGSGAWAVYSTRGITDLYVRRVKVEYGDKASAWSPNPADSAYYKPSVWSPNPADGAYYLNQIKVHNGGTYPVNPIITATMRHENGFVGLVNSQGGILQFGNPEEIDGYTSEESETALELKAVQGSHMDNQAATNNPYWGGDPKTPNEQIGNAIWTEDSYDGWKVEPNWSSITGEHKYWNGPSIKHNLNPTRNGNYKSNLTWDVMARFQTSAYQVGSMETTIESDGKPIFQMILKDNSSLSDQILWMCYYKDKLLVNEQLDRNIFTNDKFIQLQLEKFGNSLTFKISPWVGNKGRETTLARPFTFDDLPNVETKQFSTWFMRNKTWGESTMYLISTNLYWQNVQWYTDIKNRFSQNDVLTIDVQNRKVYRNGIEDLTLQTVGNMWEKFNLPPGDSLIQVVPSSWAPMFDCKFDIREGWM